MFEAAAHAAAVRADACSSTERPLFTLRSLAAVSLLSKAPPPLKQGRCPRKMARFDPSPELQGPQLESKAAKVARHSTASRESILVAFEVSDDGISLARPLSAKGTRGDDAPCGSSPAELPPARPKAKRAAAAAQKRAAASEDDDGATSAAKRAKWSAIEDATLRALMATQSSRPAWAELARLMPGRTALELCDRWKHHLSAAKHRTLERGEAQSRKATSATAVAARVVSAARTAKGAPVERLEPAACASYVPLQSPAAAPAAPLHLGAYYHAPDGRVLRSTPDVRRWLEGNETFAPGAEPERSSSSAAPTAGSPPATAPDDDGDAAGGGAPGAPSSSGCEIDALTDDALAPSAPPPALEIESLEMSDPESAPYPQMSETEIETELQNFDS